VIRKTCVEPPEKFTSATYAVDRDIAVREGVRRYGMHGISHEYVAHETASYLGRPLDQLRLIVLHLGNGASAAAIRNGGPVDTSMGMTPLEGLVMGTRGGDIDPGVLLHLLRRGHTVDELEDLLHHRSGLQGLAGRHDLRDLTSAIADAFHGRAVAEWLERLEAAGVPSGRVQQRETVYADPQVGAEALIAEVEQEGLGAVRLLAPFVRVGGHAGAAAPAPSLGADTDGVLAELS